MTSIEFILYLLGTLLFGGILFYITDEDWTMIDLALIVLVAVAGLFSVALLIDVLGID